MSGMNFFSWLRDGVRQSVVLGVSDAVEQLGSPPADEQLSPMVSGFLQLPRSGQETPRLNASGTKSTTRKKRLGKSLKEMDTETAN